MISAEVRRRFLSACAVDYQDLSGLIDDARETVGEVSERELRALVMRAITDLLRDGLLEPGFPEGMEHPNVRHLKGVEDVDAELTRFCSREPESWSFEPWAVSAQEALIRIDALWDALGREPEWNEICWFRATDKGKVKAREGQRERAFS